ncbi:MAG: A24 family peptidase [Planctomycetota bacterium]|nr:A24 family peptidase [Planctomycetota bacterium]
MIALAAFFVLGAVLGGQINHATYRFAFFRNPAISPWMKKDPRAGKRTFCDYLPLIGWTTLIREEKIHGSLFWLRPLFIEIFWGFAAAWLYLFHCDPPSGMVAEGVSVPNAEVTQWVWFGTQLIIFSLLAVATLIDFDEFMIPDQVTIPGVLISVITVAAYPAVALPDENAALRQALPMTFATPLDPPTFWNGSTGLLAAIGCLLFWCFALIPKVCTFRKGAGMFFPILVASILRRPRKRQGAIRIAPRRMYWGTPVLVLIAILGILFMILFWQMAEVEHRMGLLSSMFGMAFGMGMIWSIRIIGRLALGREAMGFGDVTLMAMIGALVGWQACLPILAVSAILALIISVPMALINSESTLPYGPYLSMGTVVVVLAWSQVWPGWLKGLFSIYEPQYIFLVLVGMTVPMFVLLLITRFVKERLIGIR